MPAWYYSGGGAKRVGPISDDELAHLLQSGSIAPETLVASMEGTDGKWVRVESLRAGQQNAETPVDATVVVESKLSSALRFFTTPGGLMVLIFTPAVLFFAGLSMFGPDRSKRAEPVKSAEELRKDQLRVHFSVWDGSHKGVTKLIKDSMHDPTSYEHVETKYADMGDHLVITTVYRGKNGFGGVVRGKVVARVDLNGNVMDVLATSP